MKHINTIFSGVNKSLVKIRETYNIPVCFFNAKRNYKYSNKDNQHNII